MKVDEGYSMADSRNLPRVDFMMLLQLMREDDNYNVSEIRGAKMLMSSRDAYVESAVGFVQVRRESPLCTVKCRITPEHKVRNKAYTVVVIINETEEKISEAKCEDCPASLGGCKHAICFLMWLVKRTEEPPVTSVACYWARPKLADAVTKDKFVMAKEIGQKRPNSTTTTRPIPNLESFVTECKIRKINKCLLTNYLLPKETLDKYSLFDIILEFSCTYNQQNMTFQNFKTFAEQKLESEEKELIEESTRQQADSKLWHTLRQGRVTGSKIYEATKCNTGDGVLVKNILGGYKVPETKAIKRGKRLEGEVVKKIESNLNITVRNCGLYLINQFIGATPDGLCDDFVVEIKCPMNEKSISNYVKNGVVSQKCKAQTQLQMHATGKKKALFCVADPKFEINQEYKQYWLYYDKLYVQKLITEGEAFWEKFIFNKLLDMVK